MSEINEEKDTKKSKSKIGALLSNSQEVNNSEVNVYYSQNDWKTSDKIEVMVEDKTTVLQLIDIVIFKLKTELYYDDIDEKKNYILMLLKKKTKKPNYDYPKCNPESLVLDYKKSNFGLVEQEKIEGKDNLNKENNINNKKEASNNKEENKEEEKKDLKKNENNEKKENQNQNKKQNKNIEKRSNKGCILY